MFQHTAARRRLAPLLVRPAPINGFNTQPPEGGWLRGLIEHHTHLGFQHTAARRRLALYMPALVAYRMFQHTAARRRLD